MRTFLRLAGLAMPGITPVIAGYLVMGWRVVIVLGAVAAVALTIVMVAVPIGIRHEDRYGTLSGRPPSLAARIARGVLNTHVRFPAPNNIGDTADDANPNRLQETS
ncbi:hypothetical protein [Nonomuraea sp. NPDC050540]|uniref:hypothetical protein n=1 Tax=Nonomuraea sp. NPDC050540 TaxID=3364367 RepID=UPI0037B4F3AC